MVKSLLVVKKSKKGESRLDTKVTIARKKSYVSPDYRKVLDVNDAKDLALFFSDLSMMFDAPVDKAFRIYRKKRDIF